MLTATLLVAISAAQRANLLMAGFVGLVVTQE